MADMKDNQTVRPVIDVAAGTVTFQVRGMTDLVLHMAKVHEANRQRAALVGMAQVRIVDAAAIGMTDDDGNIIPAEARTRMKHERMAALIAHYESGTDQWSRVREGGFGGLSITIEAIARVKGVEYDAAKAMVAEFAAKKYNGDTKKALAFLREGKQVSEAIMAIRAERAPAPKADADAALGELKAA